MRENLSGKMKEEKVRKTGKMKEEKFKRNAFSFTADRIFIEGEETVIRWRKLSVILLILIIHYNAELRCTFPTLSA